MGNKADIRRRWLGALALAAALGMLVAGETVLRERLSKFAFLVFWLICFGLTSLAMLIAILDASATRRRSREDQRALFEATLQEIARRKQAEPKPGPDRDRN